MRPVRMTSLVILWLLASGAWVHADGRLFKKVGGPLFSPAAPQRAHPQPKEPDPLVTLIVEGWGETPEDAKQMALERARREILAYFAQQHQPLEWRPPLAYIQRHLIKDSDPLQGDNLEEPVRQWSGLRLWVEITPDKKQAILQQDRGVRSESRMLLLGKLLVGVVALLGAVAGYLRLEEMTKGYYTAWLRLSAIGFVSAVGAGIWWIS